MSINVIVAANEGIIVKGAKEALSFAAPVANAFANLPTAMKGEPVATFTMEASYGRPHPLARLLGIKPDTFDVDFNTYSLGAISTEDGERVIEAHVGEHEGLTLLAYCPEDVRLEEEASEEGFSGIMSVLAIEPDDLGDLISLLSQDFSELPSQDDMEDEAEEEEDAE